MSVNYSDTEWWRGCAIYQIYPRSYSDSNGDGIGDLPGIRQRLPHIAGLHVDAIWISPFFTSPMKDFGYDVANYRDVDPMFGTLEDFKGLLEDAHNLGLRVMIDLVLSHSSDQHPWFIESRSSRDNSKADWYVWADPKPDGTPPNNWLSIFGGSAWAWESRRRQYYLHNFLTSQPDLNFHNPAVRQQLLDEVRFWLDLGVDGFRLDVANFYVHDAQLRDNPPVPADEEKANNVFTGNPYSYQRHVYDMGRPENLDFHKTLRKLINEYPARTTVAELGGDDSLGFMAEYTQGGEALHMAYTFDLLNERFGAAYVRSVIEEIESRIGDGWPCWAFSNHDVVRAVSRWGKPGEEDALGKVLLALLGSLRGSICVYEGEELGLPESEIPYERLQDPYGITFWPDYKGRDGCRTPMPWNADQPNAGFSTGEPWLPVDARHYQRTPSQLAQQPDSILHRYQQFLAWRQEQPALKHGTLRIVMQEGDVLVIERSHEGQRLWSAVNLGHEPARVSWDGTAVKSLEGHGYQGTFEGHHVNLPPLEAAFGIAED